MVIIGLCGNSGSGKSTVCKSFLKYGIPSINADMVYRDLTASNSQLNKILAQHFGDIILNEDLSLNRKELSQIVFSDTEGKKLPLLNSITHSAVIDETVQRIKKLEDMGEKFVIFDAPLLFESGFDKKCDVIIAVIADRDTKINRIMERDNIDYSRAVARLNSQVGEQFLIKHSHYVIDTTNGDADIDSNVKEIFENIIKVRYIK